MLRKFAFALGADNRFLNRHFGDADKFHLYELTPDDKLTFVEEKANPFKNFDEHQNHGSAKKGQGIIGFLSGSGVQVLVSKQFGPNIKMIHKHFIPVKISDKDPIEVVALLEKKLRWINDEWNSRDANYHLFVVQNGILKLAVKE